MLTKFVQKIARAFLKARQSVPKRPHPLAPQTGGVVQKAMGMHGRVQDTVRALCLVVYLDMALTLLGVDRRKGHG